MKTGVINPKVTSRLERLMREIGRRIKLFDFNWSEKGCTKVTMIILKMITDPKLYENYWDYLDDRISKREAIPYLAKFIKSY